MNVSIVLVNARGHLKLSRALRSIVKSHIPQKVRKIKVVVVDCQTDPKRLKSLVEGITKYRQNNLFDLEIIHLDKDVGPAEQHNIGFRQSLTHGSRYIIFLDNDVEVSTNWLLYSIEFMETNPRVAATQFMLVSLHEKDSVDRYCNQVDPLLYGFHPCVGESFYKCDKIQRSFYPDGAAFVARTRALVRINIDENLSIYDKDYFIVGDDLDFGWRIWLSGETVFTLPNAIVYHSRSFKYMTSASPRSIYFQTRNKILSMIKNYKRRNLMKYLCLFIFLEISRAIYLSNYNKRHALAIFKAILGSIKLIPSVIPKRRFIQTHIRVVDDEHILSRVMVPFNLNRLLLKFKNAYAELNGNK